MLRRRESKGLRPSIRISSFNAEATKSSREEGVAMAMSFDVFFFLLLVLRISDSSIYLSTSARARACVYPNF